MAYIKDNYKQKSGRNKLYIIWEMNILAFAFPSVNPFSETQLKTSLCDLLLPCWKALQSVVGHVQDLQMAVPC